MHIIVAGSSGFVGTALVNHLTQQGHKVQRLLRGDEPEFTQEHIVWEPEESHLNPILFEGVDAVINLCGDPIATRWTEEKKRTIHHSRVHTTTMLSKTLAQLRYPPKVLVNASAIGYYGDCGENVISEEKEPGTSFLAKVCQEWEKATEAAERAGIRVVRLRFGVVLDPRGGMLGKMLPPFRSGLGGVIGSGKQYVSWVSLADLIKVIAFAIEHTAMRGAVNVVSPHPVTNRELTEMLGRVLHRPTVLGMPAWAVRMLFGEEMANDLLLSSIRAEPKVLLQHGYSFTDPMLEAYLRNQLA